MILAFIEHDRGAVSSLTLQMIAAARALSAQTGDPLHAIAGGGGEFQQLERQGVAHLHCFDHESLHEYAPTAWARCISRVIEQHKPSIVLAAATDRGNELMAWAAAITGLPLAVNCIHVRPGEPFQVIRQRYGGSLLEEANLHGSTKMLTTALHVFEPAEVENALPMTVETISAAADEKDRRARVVSREETQSAGVNLHTARVVVGGGRGVGSAEGFRVLEELAGVINGAVGGSRVATNNGWRPHAVQVGLTGNRIAPVLYIACGISGAIQHQVGCKGAKRILVINKDREAPFFRRADHGVIGDLHEILPALTAEIRKRKSAG